MPVTPKAASAVVSSLLVACNASRCHKSPGALFAAVSAVARSLTAYYADAGTSEVTIAFGADGVEIGDLLVPVPDQVALIHDLACIFDGTPIILNNPGETGLAILMRRLADEVSEPGLGPDLDKIPGVRPGAKRELMAVFQESLGDFFPPVSRHEAVTGPPPAGGVLDDTPGANVTCPPPAGWNPEDGGKE